MPRFELMFWFLKTRTGSKSAARQDWPPTGAPPWRAGPVWLSYLTKYVLSENVAATHAANTHWAVRAILASMTHRHTIRKYYPRALGARHGQAQRARARARRPPLLSDTVFLGVPYLCKRDKVPTPLGTRCPS